MDHFKWDEADKVEFDGSCLKVKVRGKPIALERHRWTTTGTRKQPHTYNPVKKEQESFRSALYAAMESTGKKFEDGITAWDVSCGFFFPRPKHHFTFEGKLRPDCPKWHVIKPDLDNLVKFVVDAIEDPRGFSDDKAVAQVKAWKRYTHGAEEGCVLVKLSGLK